MGKATVTHHLLPRSRCPERIGDITNHLTVHYRRHCAYHHLFANLFPHEVVAWIIRAHGVQLEEVSVEARSLLMVGAFVVAPYDTATLGVLNRPQRMHQERFRESWDRAFGRWCDPIIAIDNIVEEWTPPVYAMRRSHGSAIPWWEEAGRIHRLNVSLAQETAA